MSPPDKPEPMASIIDRVVKVAAAQARRTVSALSPGTFPHAGLEGAAGGWKTTLADEWTAGFFPGVLWQLHNLTGGEKYWLEKGKQWTQGVANKHREWVLQNDFGFLYLPSFYEEYLATGSEYAKKQVLAAAEATAWAWNPASGATRTFEGWDPPHATSKFRQTVIIDHMMNIEVLIRGAELGGPHGWFEETSEDWVNMAVAHARSVAKNHMRPDGSTYHVVEYSPRSGKVNKQYTFQGYEDYSTWARGHSWAMAGFSKMHALTGKEEFLKAAKLAADKWLDLLMTMPGPGKGGWVPNWDFDAPYEWQFKGPMDSSAAAVAALAFLQLAEKIPSTSTTNGTSNAIPLTSKSAAKTCVDDCRSRYLCAAVNTLRLLGSREYLADPKLLGPKGSAAVLMHGTGNRPANDNMDVGLVYGDYYFLKALALCKTIPDCILS